MYYYTVFLIFLGIRFHASTLLIPIPSCRRLSHLQDVLPSQLHCPILPSHVSFLDWNLRSRMSIVEGLLNVPFLQSHQTAILFPYKIRDKSQQGWSTFTGSTAARKTQDASVGLFFHIWSPGQRNIINFLVPKRQSYQRYTSLISLTQQSGLGTFFQGAGLLTH